MLTFCKSDWQADCCQIKDPSGWGSWSWQSPIIYSFLLQLPIIYFQATEGKPTAKENWWTHHPDMSLLKMRVAISYTCCKDKWSMGTCKLLIYRNPGEAAPNLSAPVLRWDFWCTLNSLHVTFSVSQRSNDSAATECTLYCYRVLPKRGIFCKHRRHKVSSVQPISCCLYGPIT